MSQRLSILVAMTPDRVIGRDGSLPWHLPADLAHFKRLTMGHHIIMGRKTYDSLTRPLPGRSIVVLTRHSGRIAGCAVWVGSFDEAISVSKGDDEVFIVGGGEVYREGLIRADRIYQTLVHAEVSGDTLFPEFDEKKWNLVHQKDREPDARNVHLMSFRVLDRA